MPYVENPRFPLELENTRKVWRFIDFPKFLSILEYKSLFFSRIDKLGDDLWEGQFPRRIIAKTVTIKIDHDMHDLNPDDPAYPSSLEELTGEEQKSWRDSAKVYNKFNFANCWFLSEYESNNLWQIYSRGKGIAIQSTVGRLKESLVNYKNNNVYFFRIKYIDYDKDALDDIGWTFATAIYKRKEFEDEKELRALVTISPSKQNEYQDKVGIDVNVDVDMLIEKVYLSPQSPLWHFNLVEKLLKKYNMPKSVQKSKLSQRPM